MSLRNSTLFKSKNSDKSLTNSQIRNNSKKNTQRLETKSSLKSSSNYGNYNYKTNNSKVQRQNSNRSLNSSQRSISPSTRFNNKSDLSGFQIVQDSPKSRTIINKLGLKLEAICQKPGHDRQKINFICIARDCNNERLGCATCFLEEHSGHTDFKLRIEDFLEGLKERYEEYYDELKEFKNIQQKLENPLFLSEIIQELEEVKLYFSTKIEDAKLQVLRDFEKLVQEENMKFAQQVQNQKCYSVQIDNSMQKTIFEMEDNDMDVTLQLWHKSNFNDISKASFSVDNRMAELENLFKTSFEMYKSNLKYEIDSLWENYKSMDLPDKQSEDDKRLIYLKSKKEAVQRQFKTSEQINEQLKQLKKQILDTETKLGYVQPHDCHQQQKRYQSPLRAQIISSVSPSRNNVSPLKFNNNNNNVSNILGSKSDFMSQSGISQNTQQQQIQKSSFRNISPKNIPNIPSVQSLENHLPNLNHEHEGEENMTTVPIFECCQQAFKCVSCHNNYSQDHEAKISNPSKRYCLKCTCIFSVNMPSDTAVPCVQCMTQNQTIVQQINRPNNQITVVRNISQSRQQQQQPLTIVQPPQRISRQQQHHLTSTAPQILTQSLLKGNQSVISSNQSYIIRK